MFSLAFFEDHTPFPYRLLLTGAAWAAGLLAALYGLRQFHRRRAALLTATDDPSAWESPRAPAIVVAVFASMLGLMVVYAVASHQTFQVHSPTVVGGGGRGRCGPATRLVGFVWGMGAACVGKWVWLAVSTFGGVGSSCLTCKRLRVTAQLASPATRGLCMEEKRGLLRQGATPPSPG